MRIFILVFSLVFSLEAFAKSEIHIIHCIMGCPKGTPETNDLVIREIYALSSNDETKFADWVAYHVTSSTIGSSKDLTRNWQADPFLEKVETLEPEDYKGANKSLKTDRGHQAPLASFAGTIYWRDTNILSNITPQKANLNQGAWKELEAAVRHVATHTQDVWVITGPLYETDEKPLPNSDENHKVPSGYWKVVISKTGQIAGFIFDQATSKNAKYCDLQFKAELSDIEKRSGLDLLPQAPLNWPTGDLRKELGC